MRCIWTQQGQGQNAADSKGTAVVLYSLVLGNFVSGILV